uniref:Erythropoietin n=1 Tax=Labrus bergylta TaxID=56723 RepID=A0A3Q3EB78_9LABR
ISVTTGLLALLLILLEWTRPGLPSPLRPICDLRVLNHFIKEARDAEVAMKSCREGCSLSESVTVPQTRVELDVWEKKNALEQAQEVQTGLWLLKPALSLLQTSVTNTALLSHIDNSIRNLLSISAVLRSLNIQFEYLELQNKSNLLQVHVNFLRGKVRLLLLDAQACQQDVS